MSNYSDYVEFKDNIFYFSKKHNNDIKKLMYEGLSYEQAFNKVMEPYGVQIASRKTEN